MRPLLLVLATVASTSCASYDDLGRSLGAGCDLANCNRLVGVYDHQMKRGESRTVAIAKPDGSALPIWIWDSSAPHVVHVVAQKCKRHVECIELYASSPGTAEITAEIRDKDRERYPVPMRRLSFSVHVDP